MDRDRRPHGRRTDGSVSVILTDRKHDARQARFFMPGFTRLTLADIITPLP
jgi:hypothetical protein